MLTKGSINVNFFIKKIVFKDKIIYEMDQYFLDIFISYNIFIIFV